MGQNASSANSSAAISSVSGANAISKYYEQQGAKLSDPTKVSAEDAKLLCQLFKSDSKGVLGGGDQDGFLEATEGGSYIGGFDDLQQYANSAFSKAKEKLIRSIASDVFSALKLQGSKFAETAPIADVVKHLQKVVPNVKSGKKFNDSFNKSSGKQKDVCLTLANAINKHYGSGLIPTDLSDAEICNRVTEVMNTLFTGLHTEFMTVAGDVLRILRNVQLLHDYVDASYKKQQELVQKSGDQSLVSTSASVQDFYNKIKEELNRQTAMLANIINVSVGPTGKSLITLLEENKDFSGLVADLRVEAGTSAFGDKIAYMLAGVSSVAHSAELIDKALKKIGMSASEFKSSKNINELRMKIYEHIQKKGPTSKQLDEMLAAAEIIYKNDYSHKAVADLLAKKGGCGCDGGQDGAQGGAHGGDDDDLDEDDRDQKLAPYWNRKALGPKIAKKDRLRKMIFADFRKLLKSHYRSIVEATAHISKNIGTTIPINDDVDRFITVFSVLPTLDSDNLHVALSGYAKDSVSREKREQFMNTYHLVDSALEPLTKGPGGQHFKTVQTAIKAMVQSIDNFSDKMVKSLTEIHIDRPDEIRNALKQTASNFFGSFEGGDDGDEMMGSGSFVEFKRVQNELRYFYSIASIKTNLSRVSEEMATFGDDYEQILGEEAGWMINQIQTEFNNLIENARPDNLTPIADDADAEAIRAALVAVNGYAPGGNADFGKKQAKESHRVMLSLWKAQRDAKIKMVEVAQAIDLYLRSFADSIAKTPDAISSVVKMLDQVEIVAKWFNDRSGDNVAALFEAFPSGYNNYNPVFSGGDSSATVVEGAVKYFDDKHYYDWLENKNANNAVINALPGANANATAIAVGIPSVNAAITVEGRLPGNPFLGVPSESNGAYKKIEAIRGLTEKTVKSMRALENILSAFESVGNKFGNLDLRSKTFMSPAQIFNALMQYITASALTNQFNPAVAASYAAQYHGDVEDKEIDGKRIPHTGQEAASACFRTTGLPWSQDISGAGAVGYGLVTGVNSGNAVAVAVGGGGYEAHLSNLRKHTAVAMSAIPLDGKDFYGYHNIAERKTRLDAAGWKDRFYDTDLLFMMTIKSIVCKMFTVVDAYRLFNRPTMRRDTHYSLNPLRTILGGAVGGEAEGGAVGSSVKVNSECLELYLRLPLLAEWYRDKFAFKEGRERDGDGWKLSIVPTIDGVWSGIMNIIFDKADYVTEGNYTENQVQKIIEEINNIHKSYKSRFPKATVRSILNSFVVEMNRAFGFIKQQQIERYMKKRRDYLDGKDYEANDSSKFLDYDILDADGQYGRSPAPSDKYVSIKLQKVEQNKRSMVHLQQEILKIRTAMDVEFNKVTISADGKKGRDEGYSFVNTLRNYKKEMEAAKSEKEQYEVVLRMIQGVNKMVNVNSDKLIMVHEAVAAPLLALYNVWKVLAKYNALLHGASLKNVNAWSAYRVVNAVTPASAAIAANRPDQAYAAYYEYIKVAYPHIDAMSQKLFASALVGDALTHSYNREVVSGVSGYLNVSGGVGAGAALNLQTQVQGVELAQDVLAAVLDLCANPNKLVQCNVTQNAELNIDASKLQEICLETFHQVKSNINKLRVDLSDHLELLAPYEEAKYPGSIRWLDENLFEILFTERDKTGLSIANSEHIRETIKELSKPAGVVASVDNSIRSLIYYKAHKQTHAVTPQMIADIPYVAKQQVVADAIRGLTNDDINRITANGAGVDVHMTNGSARGNGANNGSPDSIGNINLGYNKYLSAANAVDPAGGNNTYARGIDLGVAGIFAGGGGGVTTVNVLAIERDQACCDAVSINDVEAFERAASALAGGLNLVDKAAGFASLLTALIINSGCYTLKSLEKPTPDHTGGGNIPAELKKCVKNSFVFPHFEHYGSLPNICISNDLTTFPFNVAPIIIESELQTVSQKDALKNMKARIDLNTNIGGTAPTMADANSVVAIPSIAFENIDTLNKWNVNDFRTKSLLLSFNNLVGMFLRDNLDPDANKFYIPLIESFMVTAAKEVKQNKAFPNVLQFGSSVISGHADSKKYVENTNTPFDNIENSVLASPPQNTVLFASHGIVMNALYNSVDTKMRKKRFHYDSMAEVSQHMKDRMKGMLPYYSKLLGVLAERAELLKKIINYTSLKDNLSSCVAGAAAPGKINIADVKSELEIGKGNDILRPNTSDAMYKTFGKSSNDMLSYHTGLLSRISELSNALRKSIDAVYKELQDTSPYFMETTRDFILDYKSRTGSYPLMPMSHVLAPQMCYNGDRNKWDDSDASSLLLPNSSNGSAAFKFNYAARLLLGRSEIEPQMDHMPGAKDLYNSYAAVASKSSIISASEYAKTMQNTVKLARFLNDGAAHGKLFDAPLRTSRLAAVLSEIAPNGSYLSAGVYQAVKDEVSEYGNLAQVAAGAGAGAHNIAALALINDDLKLLAGNVAARNAGNVVAGVGEYSQQLDRRRPRVYQNKNVVSKCINLTENTNMKTSKADLAEIIGNLGERKDDPRSTMRIYNILDMNIVPINVHAFMREVPFVNILNYSYTFDRMVHDFVMPKYVRKLIDDDQLNADNLMIKSDQDINSTRELMVKLLTYPYADLSSGGWRGKQYYALLGSLFNGNDDLKLSRPRYLSDQLWHKALITSSVQLVHNQARADGSRYDQKEYSESNPTSYEATRSVLRFGAPTVVQNQLGRPIDRLSLNIDVKNNRGRFSNEGAWNTAISAVPAGAPTIAHLFVEEKYVNIKALADTKGVSSSLVQFVNNVNAFHGDGPLGRVLAVGLSQAQAVQLTTTAVAAGAAAANAGMPYGVTAAGTTTVVNAAGAAASAQALTAALVAAVGNDARANAQAVLLPFNNQLRLSLSARVAQLFAANAGAAGTGPYSDASSIDQISVDIAAANVTGALNAYFTSPAGWPAGVAGSAGLDWPIFGNAANTAGAQNTQAIVDDRDAPLVLGVDRLLKSIPGFNSHMRGILVYALMLVLSGSASAIVNANILALVGHPYVTTLTGHNRICVEYLCQQLQIIPAGAIVTVADLLINAVRTCFALHNAGLVKNYLDLLENKSPNDLHLASRPVATNGLKYYDSKEFKWRTNGSDMKSANVVYCAEVGRARFDTRLVRNLTWLVQLQRIMRVVLIDHLAWINTPVVKGLKIVDSTITEYDGNENFEENGQFDGSNYDLI